MSGKMPSERELRIRWLQNAYNVCDQLSKMETTYKEYWRGKRDGYESVAFNLFEVELQRQEEA